MNDAAIQTAIEAVSWLGEQAAGLKDDGGATMHLLLSLTASLLIEYQYHKVVDGKEPYDALAATVRGDLKVSEDQIALWNALRSPENKLPKI